MSRIVRDHLFINYATENEVFAEWLALKLTAEGYAVWCDRLKLLGGESYPEDIDEAIREQTFRFLALVSRDSVHKPNPLKERTLALNLARERGEDFVIPLNVDGVRPTELGWMLSDLTYVRFDDSWAAGLSRLLEKLESINAPRPLLNGREVVSGWLRSRDSVSQQPERIWTNLLAIKELPHTLLRLTFADHVPDGVLAQWPHYRESTSTFWAFEMPEVATSLKPTRSEMVRWDGRYGRGGLRLRDVVTRLLRSYLERRCLSLGMTLTPDDKHLYFPPGLLPNDRLTFTTYDGRKTWVRAVGTRTFRIGSEREQSRYHLSPTFRPNLWKYGAPVVQLQMRVFLSDLDGHPLDSRKAARRRRAIGRAWWNHQWLMRIHAVADWIAAGEESVNLALTLKTRIVLGGRPIPLCAPVGIDERIFHASGPDEPPVWDELDEIVRLDRAEDDDDEP